ncbi:M949_RS01915 family surface polysaccharide biosynthesis protein [uncultured Maribacter sp.]|uniref:M949_RS01915 family surface polysaccharide biosynthesis protein n=1 Tax=uncultured Maribacter sp. TaxID=431308 RepID=UPI002610E0AF|nr:hypothetical protein [uncultured Maribacter sp.]
MYKLLFLFFGMAITYGQKTTLYSVQLSKNEIDTIFSLEVKKKHNITFRVYRAYRYEDVNGQHLLLMTENAAKKENTAFIKENKHVYNDSIKAYFFDLKDEQLELKRTLTDFIGTNEVSEEFSIAYWTKFFALKDYDGNGTIDPILIYGSYGNNGTDDGRIKIMVFQGTRKSGIRHQNGTLDSERNTKVDASFYELPMGIQKQVMQQMQAITANGSGIFPDGWQKDMKAKKLVMNEF